MKKQYDFAKGVRGKFYFPDAEFNLPIYLEPEIEEFIQKPATEKTGERSQIVNQLLRKDLVLPDD